MTIRPKLNVKLAIAVLGVCSVSAFPYGYHMGSFNVIYQITKEWITEVKKHKHEHTNWLWSLAVGAFPAGGAVGALFVNHKAGYQKILFHTSFLLIASQLLVNLSKEADSFVMLVIGRFFIGVTAGLCSGVAPIYLADVSPAPIRGVVVTFYELSIVLATWLSEIIGLPELLGKKTSWTMMFAVASVVTAIGTVVVKFCPESPQYLLMTQKDEGTARKNLIWLRGTEDIDEEMAAIKHQEEIIENQPEVTIHNIWSSSMLLCFMVVVSEQLCGVSVLLYFSTETYREVGFGGHFPCYATAAMGAALVNGTLVSLCLVEIVGRRLLLLVSLGSLFFITVPLTAGLFFSMNEDQQHPWKYVYFASVKLFMFMYGIGVGSARWLIVVEVFDHGARPLAMSLLLPANFLISYAVAQSFLILKESNRVYVFVPCVIFDFVFFWLVYAYMPETLGKTPQEIEVG